MYFNQHPIFLKYTMFFLVCFFFISCDNKTNEGVNKSLENSTLLSLDKQYDSIIKNDIVNEGALRIIYSKARAEINKKENDSFNIISDQLFKRVKIIGNKTYEGFYYNLKGHRFQEVLKKSDSGFFNYNKAKNLFIETNDSLYVGYCFLNMAIIQKNRNDYHGAEENAVEGLAYLKKINDKKNIASLYSLLGKTQRELFRFDDAIENCAIAVKMAPNVVDKNKYKNNLAATYIDIENYTRAKILLAEVLEDTLSINKNPKQKARILDNLAYAKWLENPKISVEDDFLKAMEIRDSKNDMVGLIASYTHLAEYYLKNNDTEKVINYGEKVIDISRKSKRPIAELDVLRFMKRAKPNSIPLRNRYISLSDSMKNEDLKARNLFAKAKYDTKEAKDENVKLQKENEKKDIENQRQELLKLLYGTIAIAIVIIAFIVIYFLYKKHKREKVLEVYNTETRISKKVHDELANDMYNVMMVLQKTQKTKGELPTKLLNQVEDIYVRTRNISHENNSIDIGEDYTDGLREMIGDYNTEETAIIIKDIENPSWDTIDNYKKIVVHRVLQELMVNMKKHSKATVVVLTFSVKEKQLIIQYSDNGIGLPFIKASKKDLLNMENRIQSVEGTLNFDSESGKGLKLAMIFPV